MEQTPHLAILPSPGMGHLLPLVELAKQLAHHHGFNVTLIVPTTGPPPESQKAVLAALPSNINHLFLPPVHFPPDMNPEVQLFLTISRCLSSIRDALKSLLATTGFATLIVDAFGIDAFDVARELGVPPYLFFTAGATTLSFCFYLPKLDEMVSCEYRDLPEPVQIPGCFPIHGRDLLAPVQDRSGEAYKKVLYNVKRFRLAEGVLVNSFMELEEGGVKALQEEEPGKPPVYVIGPLIGSSKEPERSECLRWLDKQPDGSVLFVSFGSGGTLSYDQINELALGLEMSGQRFLWVVRSPNDKFANGAFFDPQSQNDPLGFLPKGFLDRTKGQGLVVPSWAPQIEVLGHRSTGGFLTHCGWNSTLETVVHGVPMIVWPLFAEQRMNAIMLTEWLNVALRPNANESGLVERKEIEKVVKDLMKGEEGNRIRNNLKELQDAAVRALGKEGSSTKSLSKLAIQLKNQNIK